MITTYMPDRRGNMYGLDKKEHGAVIREARAYLEANRYDAGSISTDDLDWFFWCYEKQINRIDFTENWWAFMYSSDLYVNHGCEWCALFRFLDVCDITQRLERRVAEARASWEIQLQPDIKPAPLERDGYTLAASYC